MVENTRASTRREPRRRGHRWAFPLGLLIIMLATLGLIVIIISGVNMIKDFTDDSEIIKEYETFLTPVVMNDPSPFDDITTANVNQLIDSAIWALLKSEIDPNTYEYEDGNLLIPQVDIEAEFVRLYSADIKLAHQTVQGYGYTFQYDETRKCYKIPLTGVQPLYTPKVVDINKKGNTIVLTVGYLGSEQWSQDKNGNMIAPEPDKYMKISLREKGDSYYISAIQSTDAPETAVNK